MITTLEVPYVDSRAAGLGWALDLPPIEPLGRLVVRLASGWTLDLRVLGASHQVLASAPGDVDAAVSEVVACGLVSGESMPPARAAEFVAGYRYRFSSKVDVLSSSSFDLLVTRLHDRLAAAPHAVVGRFPGHPLAVTALVAVPPRTGSGVVARWRTWHAYPEAGEVVTTDSAVIEGAAA